MKKLFTSIIVLVAIILFNIATPVGAIIAPQSEPIQTDTITSSDLFSGQRHSYSVIFRGNGEALTFAKIVFTNTTDADMTKFSFEIPKVVPSEIEIYQMQLKGKCIAYLSTSKYTEDDLSDDICQQYEEGNYDNDYYYSYYGNNNQAEYTKISGKNLVQNGSKFNIQLPVAVKPNKTSSLVIAYAAKGYVKESLGLFKFNFESIKVASRIKELKVAIDVDTDLILKGKNAKINYGTTKNDTALSAASAQESFSSGRLDNIIGGIGNYTQLTKTASNLSKNETFTVKGEYSTNWYRLYLGSIVVTILIISGIIVGFIYLAKYLKKRGAAKKTNHPDTVEPSEKTLAETAMASTTQIVDKNINVGVVAIWSFVSSIMVVIWYAIGSFIDSSNLLSPIRSYGGGISALFSLIAILVVIVAAFGPAVIVSVKRGWKYLVPIILAQIAWYVIFIILLSIFYRSGSTDVYKPHPVFVD